MADKTLISWCDATWNPWIGCTKVSDGCSKCYAAQSLPVKFQGVEWGHGQPRKRTSGPYWDKPSQWNRKAEKEGRRLKVFCASLADIFDSEVPEEWRNDAFEVIRKTPHLDWLLVTKRPRIMESYVKDVRGWPWSNVWLLTSVEDQKTADLRIPILLRTPAAVRGISYEPALSDVNLERYLYLQFRDTERYERVKGYYVNAARCLTRLDWVIIGGESGKDARPFHINWANRTVAACQKAGVSVFVKQLGSNPIDSHYCEEACGDHDLTFKDKKAADMEEWPEDLRVREFPKEATHA
jgi:protein gp37